MNALVHEISFRVKPGGIFYSSAVGPNKKLSAQQIVDRLRAARTRYITTLNFGGGAATAVKLSRHHASDAISGAEPAVSSQSVVEVDPATDNAGVVTLSGNQGSPLITMGVVKTDGTVDATKPQMNLNSADLALHQGFNA